VPDSLRDVIRLKEQIASGELRKDRQIEDRTLFLGAKSGLWRSRTWFQLSRECRFKTSTTMGQLGEMLAQTQISRATRVWQLEKSS
jgi:hypothetical protein